MKIKKTFWILFSLFFLISKDVISKTNEKENVPITDKVLKEWAEKSKKEPLDEKYKKLHDGDIYFSCQGDIETGFLKNGEFFRKKVPLVDRNKSFLTFIFHPKNRYFEGESFKDARCDYGSMQIYCRKDNEKQSYTIRINRINGKISYENLKKVDASEINPHEFFSGFCKKVDIIF